MAFEDLIGGELAGYRLVGQLGEGGMAVVFRAENLLDSSILRAIKVVRPELASQSEFVKRFVSEARVLEAMNHPNVVRFHGVRQDRGHLVMELELLDGDDLADRGRLEIAQAVDWIRQACAGVAAAHAVGMLHRDLKPENLFLTRAGVVKVLDFGLARAVAAADRGGRLTSLGFAPGTAAYMAPEVWNGGEPTPATDVYALGLTLYELLVGAHPFRVGEVSGPQLMFAHLTRPVPPLREARPDASPALEAAIARAVDKDPTKRFVDAATFAEALAATSTRVRSLSEVALPVFPSPEAKSPEPTSPEAPAGRSPRTAIVIGAVALVALVVTVSVVAGVAVVLGSSSTQAPPGTLVALRHAFAEDGIAWTAEERPAAFASACSAGWAPACGLGDYFSPEGAQKDLSAGGEAFATACHGGDATACVLSAWAEREDGQNGGPDRARKDLTQACDALPGACADLGRFLESEQPPEEDAARVALQKACDADDAWGCWLLGHALASDRQPADDTKVSGLMKKACDAGDADACVAFGTAYRDGRYGIARDPSVAFERYQHACELGGRAGCLAVAVATLAGQGVAQNVKLAAILFTSSCNQGYPDGCAWLGTLTVRGLEVKQDVAKGVDRWEKACEAGSGPGCFEIANASYTGLSGVTLDADKAEEYAQRSCELDEARGCWLLGEMQERRLPENALYNYRKGCDLGSGYACISVRAAYATGTLGLAKDPDLSMEFDRRQTHAFELACDAGDLGSCGAIVGRDVQACALGGWWSCREAGDALAGSDPAGAWALYVRGCNGGTGDAASCANVSGGSPTP